MFWISNSNSEKCNLKRPFRFSTKFEDLPGFSALSTQIKERNCNTNLLAQSNWLLSLTCTKIQKASLASQPILTFLLGLLSPTSKSTSGLLSPTTTPRSNISTTSARVLSGVPNTEKQMKAPLRPSAFIVSRCLERLMKPEARVFEMASQTSVKISWTFFRRIGHQKV